MDGVSIDRPLARRYLSVCSGIEAATVAWHPLGWKAVAFSEVDRFPSAVIAHHYPSVPNLGDMTKFKEWPDAIVDVLVGGTPCQSFSVAGLRKGLSDPRGNLMLTYLAIAARYRPDWLVWENVPGVLSSNGGRDFGAFVGALGQLGYGWAYRSLDAQYFGLAQRRERVFVVASVRGWASAAAVLFESASLRWDSPPSREAGERVAPTIAGRANGGGANGPGRDVDSCDSLTIAPDGFDASEDGTGRGTPLVPSIAPCLTQNYGKQPDNSDTSAGPMLVAFAQNQLGEVRCGEVLNTLNTNANASGRNTPMVAFTQNQRDEVRELSGVAGSLASDPGMKQQTYIAFNSDQSEKTRSMGETEGQSPTLRSGGQVAVAFNWQGSDRQGASASVTPTLDKSKVPGVSTSMQVRRLTPRECERLQGFPDDWTLIPYRGKPAADGPRYKALGNSMAVPVMAWIGGRIAAVDAILARTRKAAA